MRLLLLAAAVLLEPTPSPPPEPPRIVTVEITGAAAYPRARLLQIVRVKPGDALVRKPEDIAGGLEERYHAVGYPAARVQGSFDPATGTLTLAVDEGRVGEVRFPGLEGAAARRAAAALGVKAGDVLRERDVDKGVQKIEDASDGALEAEGWPPFAVRPGAAGQDLEVHLRKRPLGFGADLGGPPGEPLFDRVDGLTPWLTLSARVRDLASYNHLVAYVQGGWGFGSHRGHFAAGARRPFGAGGAITLGYEFHDVAASDDLFRASGLEETLGSLLFRSAFRDYYRRRGHEAYLAWRPAAHALLTFRYRDEIHRSLAVVSEGSLFRRSAEPRPNPPVAEGTLRSVTASARWSSEDRLFESRGDEVATLLLADPYGGRGDRPRGASLHGTVEMAPASFGGDFDFGRALGQLRVTRRVTASSSLDARLLGGQGWGTVPPQRELALGGLGTLRGYGYKEFRGDGLALVTLEWVADPRRLRPGPVVFYDGGAVWSRTTPDRPGSGWKSDAGFGLEWLKPGGGVLRVDLAFPLGSHAGRFARLTARLQAPF